jgi:hypothetical protein
VDAGESVVENGSVVVQRAAVGEGELCYEILNQPQAVIVERLTPEDLNLENTHKPFELERLGDFGDEGLAELDFFCEFVAEAGRFLEGLREFETEGVVERAEVVGLDDVAILLDVFGDLGNRAGFLIIDRLVEQSQRVLDF